MSPRRLLLAVVASWLLVPVTCTVVAVPAMRMLEASTRRDLLAGDKPALPPLVAVVDSAAPDKVELLTLADFTARRSQTPTLTAWLPNPNGAEGEGDERAVWRQVGTRGSSREMELLQPGDTHTQKFRYAVSKDGAVTPLSSSVFDISHMFMALAVGIVLAVGLRLGAAVARQRRPVPPPLPPTPGP